MINFQLFASNSKLSSANSFSLEESKICRLGKGSSERTRAILAFFAWSFLCTYIWDLTISPLLLKMSSSNFTCSKLSKGLVTIQVVLMQFCSFSNQHILLKLSSKSQVVAPLSRALVRHLQWLSLRQFWSFVSVRFEYKLLFYAFR